MISKSLKDYIDNNILDCNNKLEVAYTIYILLGKVLYYSPLFVRYKLDNLLPDINSITLENSYINCNSWSKLYNEILLEYGIDSKIVGDEHKLVEFNIDNMIINADATLYLPNDLYDVASDLTNIKFGLDILYFRVKDNKFREEFSNTIDIVNKRFNINRGNDQKVLDSINSNKDKSIEDRIKYGIAFYNYFYSLCDGEVERRQLFERYYPLLFKGIDNSLIDFYDDRLLSNHLLVFDLDDKKYYIETHEGFKKKSYDELIDLIDSNKIQIRYEKDNKRLIK